MGKDDTETTRPGSGKNVGDGGNSDNNPGIANENDGSDIGNDGDVKTIDRAADAESTGRSEKNVGTGSGRGRPRSSGSKSEKAGPVVLKKGNTTLFATQLVGIHKMIGAVSGYGNIIEIDDSEGEQLATALVNIMDQYKIKVNPKTLAFGQLIGTMAAIYTPKVLMVVAIREQMKKNNQTPNQPAQGDQPVTTGGVIIG